MMKAPIDAIVMSMNSLNTSFFIAHSHASRITPSPTGRNARMNHARRTMPLLKIAAPPSVKHIPAMSMKKEIIGF